MRPPQRERKRKQTFQAETSVKWSIDEKRKLIRALKCTPPNNLTKLSEFIPTKSKDEIGALIKVVKNTVAGRTNQYQDRPTKAPIEVWQTMAENLIDDQKDHSHLLGQVFTMIADFEPKGLPESNVSPDYHRLYSYLACLLRGDDLPELAQLESAVFVDLLKEIGSVLKVLNFDYQRALMAQKYALLNTKVTVNRPMEAYENVRKALQNDFAIEQHSNSAATSRNSSPAIASGSHAGEYAELEQPFDNPVCNPAAKGTSKIITWRPTDRLTKTKMFTLNPFCIPVKYLRPAEQGSTAT